MSAVIGHPGPYPITRKNFFHRCAYLALVEARTIRHAINLAKGCRIPRTHGFKIWEHALLDHMRRCAKEAVEYARYDARENTGRIDR